MAYSKCIYERAQKILKKRRNTAENEFEVRKNEISRKIPEIKEIDQLIINTSVVVAREIMRTNQNMEEILQGLKIKNLTLQEKKKSLLKSKGYPGDYLDIKYQCQICQDTGYGAKGKCVCLEKILRQEAYNELNNTVDIEKYSFSNFRLDHYPNDYIVLEKLRKTPQDIARQNLEYCISYARNFSNGSTSILMQGGTGLGKTHLSLAIAAKCIESDVGVLYSTAQQLLHKLEQEKFGKSEEGFLQSILECDLLIIDDLGTEFYTQFTVSAFYNVINTRLLERRATIINTNLTVEDILSKYSQRIASRMVGEYKIIRFYGKDYRLIK